MKTKSAGTLALVIVLFVALVATPLAFAADVVAGSPVVGDEGSLTVVQPYPATEPAPALPGTITSNGQDYSLENTSTALDPDYVKPRQFFARQAFNQVPAADAGNWAAYFPATYPISEGEFQGAIGLDGASPFSAVERYHSYLVQVDKFYVMTGLPDNDVTRLPVFMDFEVVSDTIIGGTMISTLQIVDVSFEVTGQDHLGLPNRYTAHITYRGQEGLHVLEFYDVTAYYAGVVESVIEQMAITGTYRPVVAATAPPAAPIAEEAREAIAPPEVPLAPQGFALFPLVIAGATVVIFLAIPLLYFFLLSNARLLRVFAPREEDENSVGAEIVCRRRLVLKDGVAQFKIPPSVDIFDGGLYCLAIKPYFASHEGDVHLTWQGKIIAAMPLARQINVNFKEMLITSTEAAILEAGLLD